MIWATVLPIFLKDSWFLLPVLGNIPSELWLCFLVCGKWKAANVDWWSSYFYCKSRRSLMTGSSISRWDASLRPAVCDESCGCHRLSVCDHFQEEGRMLCVSSSDSARARRWSTFWGPRSLGTTSTIPRRAPSWRRTLGLSASIRRPSLTSGGGFTTAAFCLFMKISCTRTNRHLQDTQ